MTASAPRVPAGSLRSEHAGQTVLVKGWVHRRRDHGELVFIDLRDRSGLVQVVFDAEFLPSPELLARAKELRGEFVLAVTGEVVLARGGRRGTPRCRRARSSCAPRRSRS